MIKRYIVPLLLMSCASQSHYPIIVGEVKYNDVDTCWTDSSGNTIAFIFLAKIESNYLPYFVSPICYVVDNRGNDVTIGLHSILILGDKGKGYNLGFIDGDILSNIDTSLIANEAANIYKFVGKIKKTDKKLENGKIIYYIDSIDILEKIDVQPDIFFDMSAKDRMKIFRITELR